MVSGHNVKADAEGTQLGSQGVSAPTPAALTDRSDVPKSTAGTRSVALRE